MINIKDYCFNIVITRIRQFKIKKILCKVMKKKELYFLNLIIQIYKYKTTIIPYNKK